MKKLLIFPYNGNGLEALDCLVDEFEFIGFIDDDRTKQKNNNDYPVFSRDILNKYNNSYVLAVPGNPISYLKRYDIIDGLNIPMERYVKVIHHNAILGKNVEIGYNTLIMGGCVLTSNAKIGNHVIILPNTVLHHDTVIKDYTLIGSNVTVAGNSVINENCYIGSGSRIIDHIEIGEKTLVGMGSNVIKSSGKRVKLAGNPAREIQ